MRKTVQQHAHFIERARFDPLRQIARRDPVEVSQRLTERTADRAAQRHEGDDTGEQPKYDGGDRYCTKAPETRFRVIVLCLCLIALKLLEISAHRDIVRIGQRDFLQRDFDCRIVHALDRIRKSIQLLLHLATPVTDRGGQTIFIRCGRQGQILRPRIHTLPFEHAVSGNVFLDRRGGRIESDPVDSRALAADREFRVADQPRAGEPVRVGLAVGVVAARHTRYAERTDRRQQHTQEKYRGA